MWSDVPFLHWTLAGLSITEPVGVDGCLPRRRSGRYDGRRGVRVLVEVVAWRTGGEGPVACARPCRRSSFGGNRAIHRLLPRRGVVLAGLANPGRHRRCTLPGPHDGFFLGSCSLIAAGGREGCFEDRSRCCR